VHMQSETEPGPRLAWRVNQLAEAVGLSERQIYRLQEEGKLKGVKVGRARLITDESVRGWLASLQQARAA
jgi:excisionase family DNA binding protein